MLFTVLPLMYNYADTHIYCTLTCMHTHIHTDISMHAYTQTHPLPDSAQCDC